MAADTFDYSVTEVENCMGWILNPIPAHPRFLQTLTPVPHLQTHPYPYQYTIPARCPIPSRAQPPHFHNIATQHRYFSLQNEYFSQNQKAVIEALIAIVAYLTSDWRNLIERSIVYTRAISQVACAVYSQDLIKY